jgi:hypothetical protein
MAGRGLGEARKEKRGSSARGAYWRQALGDWSRSGLSKVAFCRKRGLTTLLRRHAIIGELFSIWKGCTAWVPRPS